MTDTGVVGIRFWSFDSIWVMTVRQGNRVFGASFFSWGGEKVMQGERGCVSIGETWISFWF